MLPYASPATPVWCEPARSKCTWTFHRAILHGYLHGNVIRVDRDTHFARACAIDMHMDFTRAILFGN